MENSIFVIPVQNADDLRQRIQEKISEINANPVVLNNVIRNVYRHVVKRFEQEGRHRHRCLNNKRIFHIKSVLIVR